MPDFKRTQDLILLTLFFIHPDSAHELSCDVAIIGGGITGLSIAESLLRLGKEHSVCVFEKDSRFGGRLYDYRFERVPEVSVGKQ